jgi:hypothetical protein
LIERGEEDVVDVAGGDALGARGCGEAGEADSEGLAERAAKQQGPPLPEPPRPPNDRHHHIHYRKARNHSSIYIALLHFLLLFKILKF